MPCQLPWLFSCKITSWNAINEQFKNIHKLVLDKNSALDPVFAKKYKLEDEEEKAEAVILSTASALHWPLNIIKSWRWYNPHETEHQCEWAEDQTSDSGCVRRITHTSHTSHLIIYLLSPDTTERNRTSPMTSAEAKGRVMTSPWKNYITVIHLIITSFY